MRALWELVKSLLVGGILFLLPIGVIVLVVEKLLQLAHPLGQAMQARLFPGSERTFLIALFAIAILISLTLIAGIIARTAAGKSVFLAMEKSVLARIPAYSMVKQMITDVGGPMALTGEDSPFANQRVVAVDFDDCTQIGFVVEKPLPNGRLIVYLPGAPTAMSGGLVIVDANRVRDVPLTAADVFRGMRRLGTGFADKVPTDGLQSPEKP